MRELFATARKNAPAIIFIDELDAVGSRRNPRDAAHLKQTLNQLLIELDGFTQTEGVVVIGATNVPEALDQALTRPGRFDRHVVVPLPDVRGRLAILKHHIRDVLYAPGKPPHLPLARSVWFCLSNADLSQDVDLSVLARGTPGFSGAELQNLVNQAGPFAYALTLVSP
jgi:ATP-dependent metalloprotease